MNEIINDFMVVVPTCCSLTVLILSSYSFARAYEDINVLFKHFYFMTLILNGL